MSDPTAAFDQASVSEGIRTLCAMWIEQHHVFCDWCGMAMKALSDFDAYIAFCADLKNLWPPKRKGLPPAKCFCGDCAAMAMTEMIDGIPARIFQ